MHLMAGSVLTERVRPGGENGKRKEGRKWQNISLGCLSLSIAPRILSVQGGDAPFDDASRRRLEEHDLRVRTGEREGAEIHRRIGILNAIDCARGIRVHIRRVVRIPYVRLFHTQVSARVRQHEDGRLHGGLGGYGPFPPARRKGGMRTHPVDGRTGGTERHGQHQQQQSSMPQCASSRRSHGLSYPRTRGRVRVKYQESSGAPTRG